MSSASKKDINRPWQCFNDSNTADIWFNELKSDFLFCLSKILKLISVWPFNIDFANLKELSVELSS